MIKSVFYEACLSMTGNKLRSFLTTLGIIIGVCAVVMMVAAGQTVQNIIQERFVAMGSNLLIIRSERPKATVKTSGPTTSITLDDANALKTLRGLDVVAPVLSANAQAINGSNNWSVSIIGTTPDYMKTANWEISKGRGLDEQDIRRGTTNVVIGNEVMTELYPYEDPIGKTIRIGNQPFNIVGVLKEKGSSTGGANQDSSVMMPLLTVQRRFNRYAKLNALNYIAVKFSENEDLNIVEQRITRFLRGRHKIKDEDPNDFRIFNVAEFVENIRLIGTVLSILLMAIASISLVVGAIGIVNMMLVSVTERTREIGIRKALGAPNNWIMMQFLFEAVLISMIGGVIGLVLGIGLSQAGGYFYKVAVPFSLWPVVLSFTVAFFVGVVSGVFPAYKAMKLDPIEALRYQ
ncbi:MAG: ABC transporter permease [Alphaproteobacteria bacterium]|nr:ABC transporter permease [Alphaproteobacteria bacterium]